jgi:hypothetical protein
MFSVCAVAMKKAHVLSGGSSTGPDGHDFSFPVVISAEAVAGILGPRKFHSDAALDEALPGEKRRKRKRSAVCGSELLRWLLITH